MKRKLRRLYFRLFKRYQLLDLGLYSYSEADKMIKESSGKPEEERWVISEKEDRNKTLGWVFLERKRRILE